MMDVQELLDQGKISQQTAKALSALSKDDQEAFVFLFSSVKITVTQQGELLEWLMDLSKKEEKPIGNILKEAGAGEIFSGKIMNSHQKREKIRDVIYRKRFPAVSARLDEVRKALNALQPPKGIRVVLISPLEDNEFRLEIEFASREELKTRLEDIKSFTSSSPFIKFTDWLDKL